MNKLNLNNVIFFILLGYCINVFAEEPEKSPNTIENGAAISSSPTESPEQIEDKKNWQIAQQENTMDAYEKYLDENTNGAYRSQAVEALVVVAEKVIVEKQTKITDEEAEKLCHAFKIAADNKSTQVKEYTDLPLCKDINKGFWQRLFGNSEHDK